MRKRVVIGLLAIIAVGVLVCVVSQPRKGSVEWHKSEYRKTRIEMERIMGTIAPGFPGRLRQIYTRVTGRPVFTAAGGDRWAAAYEELIAKQMLHEQALLAAGFLTEREFRVDMTNAVAAWPPLLHSKAAIDDYVNGNLRVTDNKMLIAVTIPSNALPKWEALIRGNTVPR